MMYFREFFLPPLLRENATDEIKLRDFATSGVEFLTAMSSCFEFKKIPAKPLISSV
jgi:hypothetical protein